MTYGQIARLMDERYSPRLVGWAMHATPRDGREIPWHRVINSRGTVSTGRIILDQPDLQRLLLEAEGISFDESGRCDLGRYQWMPNARKASAVVRLARGKADAGRKGRAIGRSRAVAKSSATGRRKTVNKSRKQAGQPAKRSRKGART
jgi:methylated-DNA-protein-cysteine methyltransferase-like protein